VRLALDDLSLAAVGLCFDLACAQAGLASGVLGLNVAHRQPSLLDPVCFFPSCLDFVLLEQVVRSQFLCSPASKVSTQFSYSTRRDLNRIGVLSHMGQHSLDL
jgi:hypothetical protein